MVCYENKNHGRTCHRPARRANADICPVFWYLRYMFEDEKSSDERYVKCKSGGLLCHECKHDLIGPTKSFMIEFKKKREQAKNVVDKFMFED